MAVAVAIAANGREKRRVEEEEEIRSKAVDDMLLRIPPTTWRTCVFGNRRRRRVLGEVLDVCAACACVLAFFIFILDGWHSLGVPFFFSGCFCLSSLPKKKRRYRNYFVSIPMPFHS